MRLACGPERRIFYPRIERGTGHGSRTTTGAFKIDLAHLPPRIAENGDRIAGSAVPEARSRVRTRVVVGAAVERPLRRVRRGALAAHGSRERR